MNGKKLQSATERNSGLELLKIIAMFLVVMFHVTQTLTSSSKNAQLPQSYVLQIGYATTNIQHFVLSWIRAAGHLGNNIFFVCSAWFLLDNEKINTRKIAYMLIEVWVINFIFLVIFKVGNWYQLSLSEIVMTLLPNFYGLNWYISCYVLFYLIHGGLNIVIKNSSQKVLLTTNVVMIVLYCFLNWIVPGDQLFISPMVNFVVIYFLVAYIKLYMPRYSEDWKKGMWTFLVGFIGYLLLLLLSNFAGRHILREKHWLMIWLDALCPFFLLTAIGLFVVFKNRKFVNKSVNYISSMTLMIYIIHENYLFRTYVRPSIWIYIQEKWGYGHVLLIDLIFSLCLFVGATLAAFLYKIALQKFVYRISVKIHDFIAAAYARVSVQLLKIQ